jgi:single-strand DNA-binding protein
VPFSGVPVPSSGPPFQFTATATQLLCRNRHTSGTDTSHVHDYVHGMNVVTLIGNLATDVELKQLAEGKQVVSFVLAVDRAGKDGGADFVRISAWDRQAETCNRFLHKGERAAVEGRLRSRSWQAPDGTRRSAVEVVATRVQFLTPPGSDGATAETPFEEAAVA